MADPQARHAAVLAALDLAVQRSKVGWVVDGSPSTQFLEAVRDVAAGLDGRRRILQRHAPEVGIDGIPYCYRCAGQHPCPDYLDAAAGLPTLEEPTND